MNIWLMNERQKKQTIAAYMASVRFMDQQVGRVLDALDRLELREETIVIFLSDHGYNLGEHDCWSKVSLWEGSVRVPMIISYPGNTELHGTRCENISELIDLYPTLSDLCDLRDQQPSILQGRSLAPLIRDGQPLESGRLAYTITYGGKGKSLRSKDWRYTRWIENDSIIHEELYHHPSDPEEHKNLSGKRGKQDVLEEMRATLDRIRENAIHKLAQQK
jgi:arylsulfatase A-like enzyme